MLGPSVEENQGMKPMSVCVAAGAGLLIAGAGVAQSPAPDPATTSAEVAGAWVGELTHAGETIPVGLELELQPEDKVLIKLSLLAIQMRHATLGVAKLRVVGHEIRFGPFAFTHDRATGTLQGTFPEDLVPVYKLPLTLHRVPGLELPPRPEPAAPVATPEWTFNAGAPLWPGTTFGAEGSVYAGAEDGTLHALAAGTGRERWSFRAGGAIRTRVTVAGGNLYFQADDGVLYALDPTSGHERWHVTVNARPVVRLPPGDPKSRFDRFGSDVVVEGGRLYLGTDAGTLLCLDAAQGREIWRFSSGDSILAAPAVAGGRVFFGSFDGGVYAVEAKTGRKLWKVETGKPVVSTPAVAGQRVVVGSRSYDLFGLDAKTGEVAWQRYIWSSWVESSAVVRDGIVYVGSSDAAALYAFDLETGRPVWKTDVWGWAWGQPVVTATRVYMPTSSLSGYPVPHRGGIFAVDRATGSAVWRYAAPTPAEEGVAFGFVGSASVGDGRVYIAGLDGKVYAFPE
jgi:outer membrane protein assembly factor BamB